MVGAVCYFNGGPARYIKRKRGPFVVHGWVLTELTVDAIHWAKALRWAEGV